MITNTHVKSGLTALSALALVMSSPLLMADVVVDPGPSGVEITVTGTADPAAPDAVANCVAGTPVTCASLREAVIFANTNANAATGYDRITLPFGTYQLTTEGSGEDAAASGDLDILEPLLIEGVPDLSGARPTIDGNGNRDGATADPADPDRVFDVYPATAWFKLDEVHVRNGYAFTDNGGGMRVVEQSGSAKVVIEDSEFRYNQAEWDATTLIEDPDAPGTYKPPESQGQGGGLISAGVVEITRSTFANNLADTRATLDDPATPENDPIEFKTGSGGAINTSFETTVLESTFDANQAVDGGAINQTGARFLNVTRSTLSNNVAVGGGAINNPTNAAISVVNSTLSGNSVVDAGAGINSRSTGIELTHVTFAYNVTTGSSNKGVALNLFGGSAILSSNIFVENRGSTNALQSCGYTGGGGTALPCPSTQCSTLGYNVADDDTCSLTAASDLVSQAGLYTPPLGVDATLADNGGPTLTHALFHTANPLHTVDSPAVDNHALNDPECAMIDEDQRNEIRPRDGDLDGTATCDAGAFELFVPTADLFVASMTGDSIVDKGDPVSINIVVQNGDTSAVNNATLLMAAFPAELTAATATPSVGSCTPINNNAAWTCNFGSLAGGATASLAIDATAGTTPGSYLVAILGLTSDTADIVTANNTADRTISIRGNSDVALAATANPTSLTVGDNVTVNFTVTTNGPDAANDAVLSGDVPAGASFVSATPDAGTCSEAGGTVRCDLGDIAPSDPGVNVTVVLTADTTGTVTVSARADAIDIDPDGTNNVVSTDVTVAAATATTTSSGGGGGGGCSLGHNTSDPTLPVLLGAALGLLGLRRQRERA